MTDAAEISEDPAESKSHLPYPVVGVGASAGCIAALQALFSNLRTPCGMAFVVVVHLSPEHESPVDAILQRVTSMRVVQVREPMRIEPDCVYVLSPALQLSMVESHLQVAPLEPPHGHPVAIDRFFRTLACAQRERAYCVVLSGSGPDGAPDLSQVRECGGVTLVQAPDDAEYDAMPNGAIATGDTDFVLPAAEIGPKLNSLWDNLRRIEMPEPAASQAGLAAPPTPDAAAQAEQALAEVMQLVRTGTGHDFSRYKRATVLRRIERRLHVNELSNLSDYLDFVRSHPTEPQALRKELLISITGFFRDAEAFDALRQQIDAVLFEPGRPRNRLRAWVAGCASGEEAYSVAMLLAEAGARQTPQPEFQVFASDIDESAIAQARIGAYPDSVAGDVTSPRLRRFFTEEHGHPRVREELRERVLFAVHDLLRDPPFSNLDLLCCRNLLIYLDREVQQQVLQVFHFALKPGGLLFLGSSESPDAAAGFVVVDRKHRIYRADGVRRAMRGVGGALLPLAPRPDYVTQPPAPPMLQRLPQLPARGALDELHERLREAYLPPTVLIDAHNKMLHSTAAANAFLRFAAGEPSQNLLDVVRPELRPGLRTALFRAWEEHKSVDARRVRLSVDALPLWITMRARPVERHGVAMMMVLFDQSEITLGPEAADGSAKDPTLAALEDELCRTREMLRDSLGESAASNEELQATNEELRSTSEELETSNGELRALNEELVAMNQELKARIDETAKINDDLKNLMAATDIATVFVDRGMRIKRFTPQASRLFNLIASDVGRPLLDITHRLDYAELENDAVEVFESLRTIEREVQAAGGETWLVRVLPYRTAQGLIDGAVLNFVDLSAMRHAQRQLAIGEANLRRVVESTQDYAIITLDTEGTVTGWNPGAARLFGFERDEMTGQPLDLIFLPEDRAAGAPAEERERARTTGRAEDERWHLRRDGQPVYCSGIMTPLHERGELLGFAKIARDVSATKRIEEQFESLLAQEQETRAELQRAFALKDEFLAVMSHELKHPLNLIHMNAELLSRLPQVRKVPAVAHAAEVIRRTVLSQAKIIDDLLDLSRMRTGKLTLNRQRIEWIDAIAHVRDAIQGDAQARGLTLETRLDAAASAIDADPVRIEQIVWNLVSNAVKFTPQGGSVRLALTRDGEFGRLDVSDTGQGIAPEFLSQVFDMFRQANRSSTRSQGGMGIGLALVKQLVEEHGGKVAAASGGPGRGATFSVWLPLSHSAGNGTTMMVEMPTLAGLRILLVDDTEDALLSFATLLKLEGATVTAVTSGAQALAAARETDFDLILSDVAMPQMDGYELIAKLRENARTHDVPAVALTGFGRVQDVQRALAAGFDEHLGKPIVVDELFAVIRGLLPVRRPDAG